MITTLYKRPILATRAEMRDFNMMITSICSLVMETPIPVLDLNEIDFEHVKTEVIERDKNYEFEDYNYGFEFAFGSQSIVGHHPLAGKVELELSWKAWQKYDAEEDCRVWVVEENFEDQNNFFSADFLFDTYQGGLLLSSGVLKSLI